MEVTIEKIAYGGSGLGRCSGKVVFVPFSAPGDRLLVDVVREKKDYVRGTIAEILSPSRGRTLPPCPHYGRCGGCQLQHMDYPLQVEAKEEILREAMHRRIPSTRGFSITMEACPRPLGYRSRARTQIRRQGNRLLTGFYRPESHAVEPIEQCPLLRPQLNQALLALGSCSPDAAIGRDIRELDIAGSEEEGLWTAVSSKGEPFAGTGPSLIRDGARIGGIVLKRKIGAFTYSVAPPAFFQANDFMTGRLVDLVLEMSQGCGNRHAALDLFSGVGLFSLPLAGEFDSVIAVENSRIASDLCSLNISEAGAKGIVPVCADVSDWLESRLSGRDSSFDLVLLDPPRTGAGVKTMKQIRALAPKTIIYVSCDPQTLVRDLSCATESGYSIERVSGLDMFPQTFHFETIVRLTLR